MHLLTSKLWSIARNGQLRLVKKKYRQRGILAGNLPLSGYF
jgi:hypothetical protein